MSYEIIYGKQFVRLKKTGEYIPMLLIGSNNCYDVGGRRTREWSPIRYYNRAGKYSEKADVILKKLEADLRRIIREHRKRKDKEATPKHILEHFGYYTALAVGGGRCANTSWNKWKSQFTNGIKKARTIEELNEIGVNLIFNSFSSGEIPPSSLPIKTEKAYFSELKKWKEWQSGGEKRWFHLSFCPHDTDAVLRRIRSAN